MKYGLGWYNYRTIMQPRLFFKSLKEDDTAIYFVNVFYSQEKSSFKLADYIYDAEAVCN